MNKKKEIVDIFKDGPNWRERDLDFLNRRLSWLQWHLERAHWKRQPAGRHHMIREDDNFYPSILHGKEEEVLKMMESTKYMQWKVRRCVKMAKLHNRYQDQHSSITWMIIN